MKIRYSRNFVKQFEKADKKIQEKVRGRIALFSENRFEAVLRNHALKGKYEAYRSINITGDLRALYLENEGEAIFDILGTHSALYG